MKDRVSASVNCYYSIFHLGVSCIDLIPSYTFDVRKEFNFSRNDPRVRRLTSMGHRQTIRKLSELGKDEPYLLEIANFLASSIELRENSSYGPGFFIRKLNLPHEMESHPIYTREDLIIRPKASRPFTPLKDLIERRISEARRLLEKYPEFLRSWIEARKEYTRLNAKIALVVALREAPYYFGPNLPYSILQETQARLRTFLKQLGSSYASELASSLDSWESLQQLDSGRKIVDGRMKLRKARNLAY
jgi:hypothetical protein